MCASVCDTASLDIGVWCARATRHATRRALPAASSSAISATQKPQVLALAHPQCVVLIIEWSSCFVQMHTYCLLCVTAQAIGRHGVALAHPHSVASPTGKSFKPGRSSSGARQCVCLYVICFVDIDLPHIYDSFALAPGTCGGRSTRSSRTGRW